MSEMETVIRVEHISKSFGGVHALQDVRFETFAGEIDAILGDSHLAQA